MVPGEAAVAGKLVQVAMMSILLIKSLMVKYAVVPSIS